MKNSMDGERVYTESQVAAILKVAGLDEDEISDLFEYVCFCDISGCKEIAEYEGWIGNGLIRKISVCEGHKHLLRGYKDEED